MLRVEFEDPLLTILDPVKLLLDAGHALLALFKARLELGARDESLMELLDSDRLHTRFGFGDLGVVDDRDAQARQPHDHGDNDRTQRFG